MIYPERESIIVGLALIEYDDLDKKLDVINREPEAQITSYNDGAEVPHCLLVQS